MTGISLADIGLTPSLAVKGVTTDGQTGQPKKAAKKPLIGPMPIEPGSVFARALYNVWKGTRTTIIKSPPGAGKSTLVARLADYLYSELPTLPVTVVTPTNGSGQALITRIAEAFGSDSVVAASSKIMPEAWAERVGVGSSLGTGAIAVQTIASAVMSRKNTEKGDGGLYIVDEAYQSSFSDTMAAIDKADQVLFVGDPGQIGPVVTVDTKVFDRTHTPPHISAPIAFERDPEAVVLSLDHTYRLGQTTTDIIQHFYDFPFDSKRAEKYVEGHAEVETSVVATAPVAHDPDLLDEVCDKVVELLGKKYVCIASAKATTSTAVKGRRSGCGAVPAALTWTGFAAMSPSRTAWMSTVRRSRYAPAAAVRPGYCVPVVVGRVGRVGDPAARHAWTTSVGIAPVGRISNPCAVAQTRAGCGPRRDFGPRSSAAARVPSSRARYQDRTNPGVRACIVTVEISTVVVVPTGLRIHESAVRRYRSRVRGLSVALAWSR